MFLILYWLEHVALAVIAVYVDGNWAACSIGLRFAAGMLSLLISKAFVYGVAVAVEFVQHDVEVYLFTNTHEGEEHDYDPRHASMVSI